MPVDSNTKKILALLKTHFPEEKIFLFHQNLWELCVATILSAQCTDKRVNEVTQKLFKKYKKLDDYVNANAQEFQRDIYSTGFYKNKTKNILGAAKKIKSEFNGKVPKTMNELITIPGIGRKTANIVLSQGHGLHEGIAVDTHVQRLSKRLGLSKNKTPEKIELDLMKLVKPSDYWWFSTALISHGRKTCLARKPDCANCFLRKACPSAFSFAKK